MSDFKIFQFKMEKDRSVDTLSQDRGGYAVAYVAQEGRIVQALARVDARKYKTCFRAAGHGLMRFSQCAVRDYLDQSGEHQYEALFVEAGGDCIRRVNLLDNSRPQSLELIVDDTCVTDLKPSQDGRFVACADANGFLEVWCLDEFSYQFNGKTENLKPERIFSFGFADRQSISELAFSGSNLDLFVATEFAEIFHFDLRNGGDVKRLSSYECGWPCYSIDCQNYGDGIAFGGEDSVVWLLNSQCKHWSAGVIPEQNPFEMAEATTVSGGSYWYVQGMPEARISAIKTNAGSRILKVRFLGENHLVVVGSIATEVWSLSPVKRVKRKVHDQSLDFLDLACAGIT